jgi:Cu+-exporting ATPase
MQQTFRIEGMHCGGCVARVTRALKSVADAAVVTLDPPQATLESAEPLSISEVQAAVSRAGNYTAHTV